MTPLFILLYFFLFFCKHAVVPSSMIWIWNLAQRLNLWFPFKKSVDRVMSLLWFEGTFSTFNGRIVWSKTPKILTTGSSRDILKIYFSTFWKICVHCLALALFAMCSWLLVVWCSCLYSPWVLILLVTQIYCKYVSWCRVLSMSFQSGNVLFTVILVC